MTLNKEAMRSKPFQFGRLLTNWLPGTHVRLKMRGFCLYDRNKDCFQVMYWSKTAGKELHVVRDCAGYLAIEPLSELIPFCEAAGFVIDFIEERSDYAKEKQGEWNLRHKQTEKTAESKQITI